MKAILFLGLAATSVFCQNYQVPNLDYDQTEPDCSNVNNLIATTTADLSRLNNYVGNTLPERQKKLNDALHSVQKTCDIISSSRPSLVQLSSHAAKKKMAAKTALQKTSTEVLDIAHALFENYQEEFPVLMNLKTSASSNELCQNVYDSINDLMAYLNWLIPTVNSQYVQGSVANRLSSLTSFQNKCLSSSCSAQQDGNYIFYSTLDTSPYDIGRFDGDIKHLKKLCDADDDCKAFNTDGWLKNYVRPPSEWGQPYGGNTAWGLYIKGDRPAAQDYTFWPSLDTSPYDIMRIAGADIDTLKLYCDTNKECKAFNSDGWIKNYVRPLSQWSQPYGGNTAWGLYVKNQDQFKTYDYDYYSTQDVSPYDITRLQGLSPDQLKAYCNANPDCEGFNTDGWIKNAIPMDRFYQPYGADATWFGLYVKRT